MNTREIAEAFLKAFNTMDIDTAARYCAENFTNSGPQPKPIGLKEWLALGKTMRKAFPDWRFNAKIDRIDGDVVHITTQIQATHLGELDLRAMGMGFIPATGKEIRLPLTTGQVIIQDGKVVNLHMDIEEGSGFSSIFSQLGMMAPVG